jgi:hypothetical protein
MIFGCKDIVWSVQGILYEDKINIEEVTPCLESASVNSQVSLTQYCRVYPENLLALEQRYSSAVRRFQRFRARDSVITSNGPSGPHVEQTNKSNRYEGFDRAVEDGGRDGLLFEEVQHEDREERHS